MPRETIYVIEDEEDIQELIVYNLTKEGFHVRGFASGEDALAQLRNGKADCIVLDIMLPGMDGLEIGRAHV